MVDWQNPVIVLNDLGASVLGGPLFVVVYLSVCSFFFFPIFAVTGQVLRSNLYTSSTESICACHFYFYLPPTRYYCSRGLTFFCSFKTHVTVTSWEFVCNLGFERSLLRGRRAWRWTAAVSTGST